jgi:hypothetical protein
MGLYDRDYMKGGDEPSKRGGSSEERIEAIAGDFIRRHQRKIIIAAVILTLLLLLAIALSFSQ